MASEVTVKLYHPDEPDNVVEVDEDRAALLKASGWVEDDKKTDKK